jgi:hypothetical protein
VRAPAVGTHPCFIGALAELACGSPISDFLVAAYPGLKRCTSRRRCLECRDRLSAAALLVYHADAVGYGDVVCGHGADREIPVGVVLS